MISNRTLDTSTVSLRTVPQQVDAELAAYHAANAELDLMIGTLRTSVDERFACAAVLRNDLLQREAQAAAFAPRLHELMDSLNDHDGKG